jgi:hypothetical protein
MRLAASRALLLPVAFVLLLSGCNPVYVARAGWAQAKILASREPCTRSSPTRRRTRAPRESSRWCSRPGASPSRSWASGTRGGLHEPGPTSVRHAGPRALGRLPGPAGLPDLVVPHHRSRPVPGVLLRDRGGAGPGAPGGRGVRHLPAPHGGLLHPGVVRRPPLLHPPPPRRGGARGDRPPRTRPQPPLPPGPGALQRVVRHLRGPHGGHRVLLPSPGGGADTTWCRRARDRWDDARDISRYLDALEAEIRAVYARETLSPEEIAERDGSTPGRSPASATRYSRPFGPPRTPTWRGGAEQRHPPGADALLPPTPGLPAPPRCGRRRPGAGPPGPPLRVSGAGRPLRPPPRRRGLAMTDRGGWRSFSEVPSTFASRKDSGWSGGLWTPPSAPRSSSRDGRRVERERS